VPGLQLFTVDYPLGFRDILISGVGCLYTGWAEGSNVLDRFSFTEDKMLILSRRVGEALTIGDEVTVTVLSVKGNQVRLGVQAPRHIAVHREEIYSRIKQEQGVEAPPAKAKIAE